MTQNFLSRWFGPKAKPAFVDETKAGEAKLVDPLDPISRQKPWPEETKATAIPFTLKKVTEYPTFDGLAGDQMAVGDAALLLAKSKAAMDDSAGDPSIALKGAMDFYGVPQALYAWYLSQGFIGYQACALIAQHWLVDKACSMSGEDAVRNGWVLTSRDGEDLDKAEHDKILRADKKYRVREHIVEFNRFKNIFGIRVAIFRVDSDDPMYYEKPFNIDGVKLGSYRGISQVDPYWMTPILSSQGTRDPASIGFYEPQFWVMDGKKYHISHLCIARGPQPADILKPTYIFGGVSLVQRIYERVYAAERTANEAPLMAMSKRTMAIHADLDKVMANQCEFEERLALWIKYRDNHGVKVLGTEEAMEQFDTVMSDFDSIIMNQYQIVAAIARTPSTKLLGTSPKGFNATGEFEAKSYHEELESIQEHIMMPMLERHYEILARSLGIAADIDIVCNPVDSVNTQERAELNKTKSDMGIALINAGVIAPDEERQRLIDDEHSGYDRLPSDVPAETEPGASPENLAAMEKAGAASTAAENPGGGSTPPGGSEAPPDTLEHSSAATPGTLQALIPVILQGLVSKPAAASDPTTALLALLVAKSLGGEAPAAPVKDEPSRPGSVQRTVHPSVLRSVGHDAEVVRQMPLHKLPKMRWNGYNLVIENPRGTVRLGTDLAGKEWASEMPDHYGYIKGYEGADGQDVDCFIGPNLRSDTAYVIVQSCPETGEFDEYKVMLGYDSPEQAIDVYHMAYSNEWTGFDHMLPPMDMEELRSWLEGGGGSMPVPLMGQMGMDDFKESDHPRANNGQFGSGGGGAAAPKPKPVRSLGAKSLAPLSANRDEWPAHIKALNLPPAWTNVHASSDPKAYLQAIGRDAKGRPQPVYSAEFRAAKDAEKFSRVQGMNEQITNISNKIEADSKSSDAQTRHTADAMSVVLHMGIRPGSDDDTGAEKKAHGASNLEARHVVVGEDGNVRLQFVGKKGVDIDLPVTNPGVAAMLKQRKAAAGGADGRLFPGVSDKSLLKYSHTLGSGDFKTKDFRTFTGTSSAIDAIKSTKAPTNEKEYKVAVKEVAKKVSSLLGNTPTVALQSYINPSVFAEWRAGIK